jgi:hypothetical protein
LAALSVFLVWHTLSLLVGPAPNSESTRILRSYMQPYLTFFRLDNQWEFFAQTIGEGSFLRYDVEDVSGRKHTFYPAQKLSWFHPDYFWFRSWYYRVIDSPDVYGDYAIQRFCKEHSDLKPAAISLYEMQEQRYTRDHYLSGARRSDAAFIKPDFLIRIRCPSR